jgi:hypothetical protein
MGLHRFDAKIEDYCRLFAGFTFGKKLHNFAFSRHEPLPEGLGIGHAVWANQRVGHASVYSLENSFPLVKLGQIDRWQPDPSPHAQ